MKEKIIFATRNKGKIKEIKAILGDLDVEIQTLDEAGINVDIEETGETFVENAIIKAKEISKRTNCIVLADDSGLEIDFLNGEPGVYSARYLGENTPWNVKSQKILERLEGVPDEYRTARFVCSIAAVLQDGNILTSEGIFEGQIAHEQCGTNGFGYDPIFFLPEYGCTSAEISMEKKNELSHRGKALRAMKEKLKDVLQKDVCG